VVPSELRHAVTTPFCPGCGERPISPVDLSLKGTPRS
jgi:hypothetical protein